MRSAAGLPAVARERPGPRNSQLLTSRLPASIVSVAGEPDTAVPSIDTDTENVPDFVERHLNV